MLQRLAQISFSFFKSEKSYLCYGILSLSFGFSSVLIILNFISYDLSYDQIGRNYNHIYRVNSFLAFGDREEKYAISSPMLGPLLKAESKTTFDYVRFRRILSPILKVQEVKYFEEDFYYVDPSVVSIFDLTILAGNKEAQLHKPESVVLTRKIAEKYFGSYERSIGELIEIDGKPYEVTGVMASQQENAHLKFNGLVSYQSLEASEKNLPLAVQLWNFKDFTYLFIDPKDIDDLEEEFEEMYKTHMAYTGQLANARFHPIFQPVTATHFETTFLYDLPSGDIYRLHTLTGLLVIVLCISIFNFTNLFIGLYSKRTKELAVRRIYGNSRVTLTLQFILESIVVAGLSMLVGLTLLVILFWSDPYGELFNTGVELRPRMFSLLGTLFLLFIFGIFSGTYTGWVVFKTPIVMGLKKAIISTKGLQSLQRIIVTVQFSVVFFCLALLVVISKSIDNVSNSDCGFQINSLGVIKLAGSDIQTQRLLKNKLEQLDYISNLSFSAGLPGSPDISRLGFEVDTNEGSKKMILDVLFVDEFFINTLGLKLTEGREFSATGKNLAIINERAAKSMNFESTIGHHLSLLSGDRFEIIGVVADFDLYPNRNLEPLVLLKSDVYPSYSIIQFEVSKTADLNNFLKSLVHSNQIPDISEVVSLREFYYSTMEDREIQSTIFGIMGVLSLILCLMGLVGMSLFLIEKQKKEYSIRKVFGASTKSLMALSYEKIVYPALYGILVSLPISIVVLEKMSFRLTEITLTDFMQFGGGVGIVMLLAVTSVAYQSHKLSNINPSIGIIQE